MIDEKVLKNLSKEVEKCLRPIIYESPGMRSKFDRRIKEVKGSMERILSRKKEYSHLKIKEFIKIVQEIADEFFDNNNRPAQFMIGDLSFLFQAIGKSDTSKIIEEIETLQKRGNKLLPPRKRKIFMDVVNSISQPILRNLHSPQQKAA